MQQEKKQKEMENLIYVMFLDVMFAVEKWNNLPFIIVREESAFVAEPLRELEKVIKAKTRRNDGYRRDQETTQRSE